MQYSTWKQQACAIGMLFMILLSTTVSHCQQYHQLNNLSHCGVFANVAAATHSSATDTHTGTVL